MATSLPLKANSPGARVLKCASASVSRIAAWAGSAAWLTTSSTSADVGTRHGAGAGGYAPASRD
jgi:hypothetical protein